MHKPGLKKHCYGTCKSNSRYCNCKIWTFFPINVPKSTKTQRNKHIMRQRYGVLPYVFLHLYSKQRYSLYICLYISSL